jgi:CRISPR/Cas system-associated exonuclease Cas4 (RecB family)
MPKPRRSADWNYGGRKWRLSRSKIDLFTECRRCFYLDNKLGVARPRPPSFTLNLAVDHLLKKEFDIHRAGKTSHPLMEKYGVDAMPFSHKNLAIWRENFEGVEYLDPDTGFVVSGAIDDVWVNPKGELMIVDYKATSKEGKLESLGDSPWEKQYGRQMEIYQWLFRKNGFKVSDTGYFVYVNGKKDGEAFDGKLEFDTTLIAHKGDASWVEGVLKEIKSCLESGKVPVNGEECEFCNYRKLSRDAMEETTKLFL